MSRYGKELIVDIHNCKIDKFSRQLITDFCEELCTLIDMKRADLHFWDYEGVPEEYEKAPAHLKGISAVQFIYTSNITIHTLDDLHRVYVNVFSCKDFDEKIACDFITNYFKGTCVNHKTLERI